MEEEVELRLDTSVRVWGNFTDYPGKLPEGLSVSLMGVTGDAIKCMLL